MAINLSKWSISYYPVPKNACTSVKTMMYFIEHGQPFVARIIEGKFDHIHKHYFSAPFCPLNSDVSSRYFKIAVLRDPIDRLLSCYSNRVVHHRELSAQKLTAEHVNRGARPDPSIEEFVEKLEIYREVSDSIKHHTDPHVLFLGERASYFDRLYKMSELSLMTEELSARTGLDLHLTHEQSEGPKTSISSLSPNAIEKLKNFYLIDYNTFELPPPPEGTPISLMQNLPNLRRSRRM